MSVEKPEEGRNNIGKTVTDAVLANLNDRRGFRQEFDQIDDEIRSDLVEDLTQLTDGILSDASIQPEERATEIAKKLMSNLSQRSGIEQFFDQLLYDEKDIADHLKRNPGTEVADDDSRPGVQRQLAIIIEPLLENR